MDNALTEATRATKVRFNIYIGDLGLDPAAAVDELFPTTPEAARSVIADRANDRICQLGVTAALSSIRQGKLVDGLVSAVRVMAAAIGR
ncbi:protein of uncharacterised function (DUF477) [Mycobacteroides abscessus subsp. abscessus]|nr:protein of uncharacterised function (DUF477) [Mycobacteroides abscessus subsp. abscessus]